MEEQERQREEVFAALEAKTAYEWDEDPRNGLRIVSWSDYGWAANKGGHGTRESRVTWKQFERYRAGATVQLKPGFTWDTADGITPKVVADE